MKKYHIIWLLTLLTGSVMSQSQHSARELKKLEWLVGTWQRTNTKPGRSGYERWEVVSQDELRGYGISMKGQDTVFVEKIRILSRDNTLFYVADVPENSEAVYFKLTEITTTGFVCENSSHDFPKKIAYQRNKDELKATISGDGKSQEYSFKRE